MACLSLAISRTSFRGCQGPIAATQAALSPSGEDSGCRPSSVQSPSAVEFASDVSAWSGQTRPGNSNLSPGACCVRHNRRSGYMRDFTARVCPGPSILPWVLLAGTKAGFAEGGRTNQDRHPSELVTSLTKILLLFRGDSSTFLRQPRSLSEEMFNDAGRLPAAPPLVMLPGETAGWPKKSGRPLPPHATPTRFSA